MNDHGLPTMEEIRERLMVPLHDDERRDLVTMYQALLDQHDARLRTPILGSPPPKEEATLRAVSNRELSELRKKLQEHYEHLKALRDLVEEADYERPDWADVEQQEDSLASIQEKIDYLENLLNRDKQLVKEGLFESLIQAGPSIPPFRVFLRLRIEYLTKSKNVGAPPLINASTLIRSSDDWYLPDSIPDDVKEKVLNIGKGMQTKVYSAVAEEAFQEIKSESEKDQSRQSKWKYLQSKKHELSKIFYRIQLEELITAELDRVGDPRPRDLRPKGPSFEHTPSYRSAMPEPDKRTNVGDEQQAGRVGTETNWRHLARAAAILSKHSVSSEKDFYNAASTMQSEQGPSGDGPGEAIKKGVRRLAQAMLQLDHLPSPYHGFKGGFQKLVHDLIQDTLSKEDNETKERQRDK